MAIESLVSVAEVNKKQLNKPVCWRHILGAHWTQYEPIESLIKSQVAYEALPHQLSASTAFGIAVTQLPHGKRARKLHLRGFCSLLRVKTR